jgi:hypothetical protein
LLARARCYALRGLEVRHTGFQDAFARNRATALERLTREDVPLAYWAAAAWAGEIALAREDIEAIGELPQVEALMAR